MHGTVRSLATSLQAHNQRCVGELRGPVLWSETMSARASSFGDRDLFICATPARAYDIDENRVLVAALGLLRKAAKDATDHAHGFLDDPVLRHARTSATDATRWLDHPSLASVIRRPPEPSGAAAHPVGQAQRHLPAGARRPRPGHRPARRQPISAAGADRWFVAGIGC